MARKDVMNCRLNERDVDKKKRERKEKKKGYVAAVVASNNFRFHARREVAERAKAREKSSIDGRCNVNFDVHLLGSRAAGFEM